MALALPRTAAPVPVDESAAPGAATTLRRGIVEALPLPKWIKIFGFTILPFVLFIPDMWFNYFVYSDGGVAPTGVWYIQAAQVALWVCMAGGMVGMVFLLPMVIPHLRAQRRWGSVAVAWFGTIVLLAFTMWNSLAYRAEHFTAFKNDNWVQGLVPWLNANHVSITMLVVAIAPMFSILVWMVVLPHGAPQAEPDLAHSEQQHASKLLKMRQDAETERVKAELAEQTRAAKVVGMARTANVLRQQTANVIAEARSATQTPKTVIKEEPKVKPEVKTEKKGRKGKPDFGDLGDTQAELPALAPPTRPHVGEVQSNASSVRLRLDGQTDVESPIMTPAEQVNPRGMELSDDEQERLGGINPNISGHAFDRGRRPDDPSRSEVMRKVLANSTVD